jgi:hypothetical protein
MYTPLGIGKSTTVTSGSCFRMRCGSEENGVTIQTMCLSVAPSEMESLSMLGLLKTKDVREENNFKLVQIFKVMKKSTIIYICLYSPVDKYFGTCLKIRI